MSGGNWAYFERRFNLELEEFCEDIKERFPRLSEMLLSKGKDICGIIHDIDYDTCGDLIIKNDTDFENYSIQKIKR
ncbi:MAG: hypothetical protein ABIH39_01575 [Candidatus Margulisiibacteriota bacterium]